MKKLMRNIKVYFLIRKAKRRGVFRWGYMMQGAAFHNPFSFASEWEVKTLAALIRLGKLKPNGETHSIPYSREMKDFDYRIVYA